MFTCGSRSFTHFLTVLGALWTGMALFSDGAMVCIYIKL